jgi:predicted RecA/RadA family phage recombinase
VVDFVAAATYAAGQVIQLADGRAGVITGAKAIASGDTAGARVAGLFKMAKAASVVLLDGQEVYWSKANSNVSYTGDFVVGTVQGDTTAAATTVIVDLNTRPKPVIELDKGEWTYGATNGLGVTDLGQAKMLSFDAVAEAAMAALYSVDTIALSALPIFEAWVAVYDIGDNAALDISIGLANGTHATDFDSVTEAALFHLDGNALAINAESDDGTTEVAATDTTVVAVDDQYHLLQIDCRTLADIQMYIDGVNVLPASVFKLDAATGPVFPIAHIEKTSDNTLADVRVKSMHVRTGLAG